MSNRKINVLAALSGALLLASPALAGPLTYTGYSVLNDQNVTLTDTALGINEAGGAGQIGLSGTNSIGGILQTWCIDIAHYLQSTGSFTTGTFLTGSLGTSVNALITNGTPLLGGNTNASSALQVAIWEVEYGSALTVAGPSAVLVLANTYLANIAPGGTWSADPTKAVAILAGGGANQDQAYLVAVPEPASMAILAAGLFGLGWVRRKRQAA